MLAAGLLRCDFFTFVSELYYLVMFLTSVSALRYCDRGSVFSLPPAGLFTGVFGGNFLSLNLSFFILAEICTFFYVSLLHLACIH